MTESDSEIEAISEMVSSRDQDGVELLLARHRPRLRRMIAARLDPRLLNRVDPSDVVQETLLEAMRQLPTYLRDRPLPFYPWLRQVAVGRMADLAQRHIQAGRRSVTREEHELGLADESVVRLAERLVLPESSPSRQASKKEMQRRVRLALAVLPVIDREILVLRFVEQLSTTEAAAILGITPEAVGMRRLRALRHLADKLKEC